MSILILITRLMGCFLHIFSTNKGYCSLTLKSGALIFLLLLTGVCKEKDHFREIVVSDSWIRAASIDKQSTEGYFILQNFTTKRDFLLSVECDFAKNTEFYQTYKYKFVHRHKKLDRILIPAGGETILKFEGLFIKFINLKKDLRPGDSVRLVLKFQLSGIKEINARVKKQLPDY